MFGDHRSAMFVSCAEGQLALVRDVMASAIPIFHLTPICWRIILVTTNYHVTFLPSSVVLEGNKTCLAVYKAT
jgi:hypothetical protein